MADTIQSRGDTAANWTSNNPTPRARELCVETDTRKIKIGDGTTAWTSLNYIVVTGATLADGDYGDVTVSSSGAVITIDNDVVTYAKMQNISAASKLLGRGAGSGSGDTQEITLGTNLSMSGTTLNASGASIADGDYGDITVSSSGAVWTIDNDVVTYAKMQNVSATDKVLGRSTAGAGDVEEITCTAFGRSLIDDAAASNARTTLGVVIGTDVQAYDAELAALASTTSAADKVPYYTGSGTATTADFTATGRSIVDDASVSAVRTTIGVTQACIRTVGVLFDGSGSTPTVGTKVYIRIPFTGTITKASIYADTSGSAVVDVWKDTYANYPPTIADTITASAKPTLSTAIKNEDSTLTGWTTSVTAGDFLAFNLDSVTTCTKVWCQLEITTTT